MSSLLLQINFSNKEKISRRLLLKLIKDALSNVDKKSNTFVKYEVN